jgi:hypothetical protein
VFAPCKIDRDPGSHEVALRSVHGSDLDLACACVDGNATTGGDAESIAANRAVAHGWTILLRVAARVADSQSMRRLDHCLAVTVTPATRSDARGSPP